MRKLSLALLLALAACAPGFGPNAGYRDTRVDISTRAVLEPARLAGTWHEVAGFYDPAASGCALGLTKVEPLPGERLRLTLAPCAGLGPRTVIATRGRYPGRYSVPLPGRLGQPWWVLWVDWDYRVMVIGTPSGRFGAILSRSPQLRHDLSLAARQILDFNGYDLHKLRAETH